MKKGFIILVLAVLCSISMLPVYAAEDNNIIDKGNMETLDFANQYAEQFLVWSQDSSLTFGLGQGAEIVNDVAHSGSYSIRLTTKTDNKETVLFQFFDMGDKVKKDETYVLTAWVKGSVTTTSTKGIRLFAQYKVGGASGDVVAEQYQTAGVLTKDTEWTQLKYEFKPADAKGWTDGISMIFLGVQSNCAGQLWVDDMTLTKKSDPIPDYSSMSKVSSNTPSIAVSSSSAIVSSKVSSAVLSSIPASNNKEPLNLVTIIIIAIVVIIAVCGVAYLFIFKKKL